MLLKYFPKPLLEDLINGRCIPIVGAGLSMNAVNEYGKHPPSWSELAKRFANELPEYEYSEDIEAISDYEHRFGRPKLVEKLIDFIGLNEFQLGESQKAFCKLPFGLVFTTNFDIFLETGYQSTNTYFRPIVEESDLAINLPKKKKITQTNLVKMHGDLHNPSRLIVTEEDYEGFLDRYRLVSTFLANQLIFNTPLFIGYSIDDPNFRQIWRIVKDRLGKLTRPGYAIRLKSSPQLISRFERRGICVIELPGDNYDFVLAQAFSELREFWLEMNRPKSYKKLVDKICLVAVSEKVLPIFKKSVFPCAEQHGYQISLAIDSISPEDNYIAKATSLIEGADIIVEDITSQIPLHSLSVSLGKPYLRISVEGHIDEPECDLIFRNDLDEVEDECSFNEEFETQLVKWFDEQAKSARPALERQPQLLIAGGFNRDAILASINLLIYDIRRIFASNEIERLSQSFIPELVSKAHKLEVITDIESKKIIDFIKLATQIEYENYEPTSSEAELVVTETESILRKLLGTDDEESKFKISLSGHERSDWEIDDDFRTIFEKLKNFASKDNKNEVVSLIKTPLKVLIGNRKILLDTPDKILDRYDAIFNSEIRTIIEEGNLWRNWRGIMLGRGQIWFEPDLIEGKLEFSCIRLDTFCPNQE